MVGSTKQDCTSTSKPEQHDLPSLISSIISMEWTTFSIEKFQSYPQHSFWASHSTPIFFPSPLTLIRHSHIQKILDFLPSGALQFYSALRGLGEIRQILILTEGVLHLGHWLGNEGHSGTGQGEKVSDSFSWHWENSTDECTLFSPIIEHKRENPTIEPPRVSSLSDGLCLREDALKGADVITNDL